jgi:hypothetical protein
MRKELTIEEEHKASDRLDVYIYICEDLWEKFWKKVDTSGGPNACWPFKASRNQCDYGIFSYNTPKKTNKYGSGTHRATIAAHKLAYIFGEEHTFEDPIRKSEVIMHKCRTRSSDRDHDLRCCCNPRHLKRGTQLENIHDMFEAGTARPFGKQMLIARMGKGKEVCQKDEK